MTELNKSIAYFQGEFVSFGEANVSIASAPVLYGLSVYTVFPVFWNPEQKQLNMFRLEDHFKRLRNSAKIMAFNDFLTEWNYEKFERTMIQLLQKNKVREDCLVRVSIFVDDVLEGTRMHGLKHDLSAFVYPAVQMLPKDGASLCVSSWRRTPDNAIPARAKINGSYVNAALMKHEAVLNGFDDAIALDGDGHVTESTVSNLFLVQNGSLVTPSSSTDLLEGITRDSIFKLAENFGISHQQKAIDRSELYLADEMFLCGSSMNITPVISVDHRLIGNGKAGDITSQLITEFENCGRNQTDLSKSWTTAVA